ncbi:MAG: U32 family peptidase [Bacilli bacterium]|nr:U32 family peptidase [Bacilli bacterium]
MKRVELLSPAGDLERLKVTLLYGADAVYLGGKSFGLRANATNFTFEELEEGCAFAHNLNKKVYLTLNIVFHNEDLDGVYDYIDKCVKCGIDAFIVSDIPIATFIKNNYKDVEVHISTQDSIMNYKAVQYLENKGFERVVLARELTREKIKEIRSKTNIDIEMFIHGAMCTCVSGRCALSNYVTNRDANRGGCAQICRFEFNTDNGKFTMATKDLSLTDYITELIDMGISSFKVEGRMRSNYYLATVIGTYRKIIDDYYNNSLTKDKIDYYEKVLSRVANREVSTQFYLRDADSSDQYYTGRSEKSNQDFLGQVISYDKDKKLLMIKERNYFEKDEVVQLFTPNGDLLTFTVDKVFDKDMNLVDIIRHPDEIYYVEVDVPFEVVEYSMLRKNVK